MWPASTARARLDLPLGNVLVVLGSLLAALRVALLLERAVLGDRRVLGPGRLGLVGFGSLKLALGAAQLAVRDLLLGLALQGRAGTEGKARPR